MARSSVKPVGVRLGVENADAAKRDIKDFGESGRRAFDVIEGGAKKANPALRAVDEASRGAQAGMHGLASRAGPTGAALAGLGPAGLVAAAGIGAAVLATGKALGIAREAVRDFDELGKTIRDLGIDSDLYQGLSFGALEAGVGDRLNDALRTFQIRSGEAVLGTGEMVEKLRQLDPVLLKNIQNAQSLEERLGLVADKLAETSNATEFATLTAVAFGEGNLRVAQVMADGAKGLDAYIDRARELGLVIDRDVIARAEELENQMGVAARVVDLNFKQAFIDLAPVLVGTAELISGIARGISTLIDNMRALEDRSTAGLEQRMRDLGLERVQIENSLLRRPGNARGDTRRRRLDEVLEEERQILAIFNNRSKSGNGVNAAVERFGSLADGVSRTLQTFATKGEQIATIRENLEATVAQFEALRSKEGVDDVALDTQIARARDAAARQIAQIEGAGGAKKTDETTRALEALAKTWTDKVTPATERHAAVQDDLNAARMTGYLTERQYQDALAAAEVELTEILTEERRKRLEASDNMLDGLELGFERWADSAGSAAERAADLVQSALGKTEDAIVELLTTGKLNFGEFARSIAADAARLLAQNAVRSLLGGKGGGPIDLIGGGGFNLGSFLASLFTPRAAGGPVTAGAPYLVGERGPELFVPNSSGGIVPNNALGGASFPFAPVTHIDARGSSMTEADIEKLLDVRDKRIRDQVPGWVRTISGDKRRAYI